MEKVSNTERAGAERESGRKASGKSHPARDVTPAFFCKGYDQLLMSMTCWAMTYRVPTSISPREGCGSDGASGPHFPTLAVDCLVTIPPTRKAM